MLLVSGGEVLQDTQRVCNYSAGTDTNPIYMFSKSVLDARNQPAPWPSIETGEWVGCSAGVGQSAESKTSENKMAENIDRQKIKWCNFKWQKNVN